MRMLGRRVSIDRQGLRASITYQVSKSNQVGGVEWYETMPNESFCTEAVRALHKLGQGCKWIMDCEYSVRAASQIRNQLRIV